MNPERIHQFGINEPWAVEFTVGQRIQIELALVAAGKMSADQVAERIHPSSAKALRERNGAVAIIPIHGVMAQRAYSAPTEKIGAAIDAAAADSNIKAIILHIDSPGGTVYGTSELAAKVGAAKAAKPVIAQVDSLAASAAYWVASQATEIVSTPGGDVGSIGVIAMHVDISNALDAAGVKVTTVAAGKHKAEFSPFLPLSDEARSHLMERVEDSHRQFIAAVASGRGVKASAVESDFGQGRVVDARAAIGAGMIDRIATFDETLARFTRPAQHQRRARAAQAIARSQE